MHFRCSKAASPDDLTNSNTVHNFPSPKWSQAAWTASKTACPFQTFQLFYIHKDGIPMSAGSNQRKDYIIPYHLFITNKKVGMLGFKCGSNDLLSIPLTYQSWCWSLSSPITLSLYLLQGPPECQALLPTLNSPAEVLCWTSLPPAILVFIELSHFGYAILLARLLTQAAPLDRCLPHLLTWSGSEICLLRTL